MFRVSGTMFCDFGSAAGDHVQASVSRNLRQQEQLEDPQ